MLNVYKLGLLLAKAVQLLTKRFENQVREKGTNSLSMMIEIWIVISRIDLILPDFTTILLKVLNA